MMASSGHALAIAARMNRSTSRSIAVTTSWRPLRLVAEVPNARCAMTPASRASRRQKS
jgi:hypothetical protein